MRIAFVLMLTVAVLLPMCQLVSADVSDYRAAALANPNIMHYYSMENAANPGEDTAGALDLTETAYGTGNTANIVYGPTDLGGNSSRTITPENANSASNEGAGLFNNSGSFSATASMTVEAILKVTGEAGPPLHIISGGAGASRGNFLYQEGGTHGLGTWVGGERTQFFQAAENNWYYVSAVFETNGGNTDISGMWADLSGNGPLTAITPRTHTGNFGQGGTNLAVGMHNNPNWAFVGALDEVAFYSSALSQSDIENNFRALTIPEPSTLAILGTFVLGGLSIRRLRV